MRQLFFVALLLVFSPGYLGAAPHETQNARPARPREIRSGTHWVRNSAEYRALLIQTFRLAGEKLEKIAEKKERGRWAVALDADETILNNSRYNAERERQGLGYTFESWKAWTERREARALPGAVDFLKKVRALGGIIAIVTNRRTNQRKDTISVFQSRGILYDMALFRKDTGEKEARWESIRNGKAAPNLKKLEIVMWIGDNIEDFPGLTQALRFEGPEKFGEFGKKYFVLPNPMYGSWEKNPKE